MKIAVIGAGQIGLPLALRFAGRGARVTCCDIRRQVVNAIRRGRSPVDEPGVSQALSRCLRAGTLRATTDTVSAVRKAEVVVVIVPVLLTPEDEADVAPIEAATCRIAEGLRRGTLVCYETTLPVGGTRKLLPLLERSGLLAGPDFDLAFSPERVKGRRILERLGRTPKVVGGLTPGSAARAAAFYRRYLGAPVINVGSLEAAELVKLAGMIYRDVNIALANELARYAEAVGVDFPRILRAANTDGEVALHEPGIGVGGHCTPVYPHFLIGDARRRSAPVRLAELSRAVNRAGPVRALDRLERLWGPVRGKRVLILGLGFRPQVKEHRFSPAFALRDELIRRGADVRLHDPCYKPAELRRLGFVPGRIGGDGVPEALVLHTAHPEYADPDFTRLASRGLKAVLDGRAFWDPNRVRDAGIVYAGIGRTGPETAPGTPAAIPMARPELGEEESSAVAEVLASGWVTQGPRVAEFERVFAEAVDSPFACAVSSGTAALHLALLAADVGPGDEVVTVSHSFIATANAVRHCGAVPVFVDVDPRTFNMDPARIGAAVTSRTRAILCVHQIGMPCDLRTILAVARRRGLCVIEDAACAVGSEILRTGRWERIGKPHGDAACFSFHPRKLLTTGDGGMITTRHPDWDRKFRRWRQHGMNAPDTIRHASPQVIFESYESPGFNYRMTDLQAAMGREQLRRLPAMVARRRRLATHYRRLLAGIPGAEPPEEPPWARSNWQSYAVRLPAGCDQRRVMQSLLDAGIATRRGVMCAHREPAYAGLRLRFPLPVSEMIQDRCILLPLYPQMGEAEQHRVVDALKRICLETGPGKTGGAAPRAESSGPRPRSRPITPPIRRG